MKIVRKGTGEKSRNLSNLQWVILLIIFLFVGIWLGHVGVINTLTEAQMVVEEWWRQNNASDLPTLVIDMAFDDYDDILGQRQEALASGVFSGNAADFVPAVISYEDEAIPVQMRLQQGTAVHLGEDDKWNYDVRTRNNQTMAAIQRFYLIDPADVNWLNEWAFAESLQREGLLAARIQFVHLFFNGDDKGIYTLQEGFGSELLQAQDRPEGIIVEFDPTRLWQSIAYFAGDDQATQLDPVTNLTVDDFQFFEVDTFRDAAIADDELLSAQKNAAIGLLRGLQQGELSASEVFDVERYGRFLALADLWGATDAVSLLNLRYYYNPESNRLEPIGFNANALSSAERLPLNVTYYDPTLQAAYVQAAQEVSQSEYLEQLQADLEAEWQQRQKALISEHETPLPWSQLAERQALMRRSLNPLQPVFALLGSPTLAQDGIIQIDVANVINLPVELMGFDVGAATFLDVDPAWIQEGSENLRVTADGRILLLPPPADANSLMQYTRFHLPLTQISAQDSELDFLPETEINVATRLVGQEQTQLTPARPGYPEAVLTITK